MNIWEYIFIYINKVMKIYSLEWTIASYSYKDIYCNVPLHYIIKHYKDIIYNPICKRNWSQFTGGLRESSDSWLLDIRTFKSCVLCIRFDHYSFEFKRCRVTLIMFTQSLFKDIYANCYFPVLYHKVTSYGYAFDSVIQR